MRRMVEFAAVFTVAATLTLAGCTDAPSPAAPEPDQAQASAAEQTDESEKISEAAGDAAPEPGAETGEEAATDTAAETEVFYVFKLKPRGRPNQRGNRSNRNAQGEDGGKEQPHKGRRNRAEFGKGKRPGGGEGKGQGKKDKKPRPGKQDGPRKISAGPKRDAGKIDPDNPFAVLQQLKNR